MTSVDVAVVGAGVIGASIAYHLRRRGASVLVADPGSPAAPSASWASAGGVRRQLRDPREWPLTMAARARWPALSDELGADCGFRPGGHLHLAETPTELARLAEEAAREQAAGIEIEVVDGARARELAPPLTAPVAGGTFTPGDGQADPRLTTRAFLDAARREGADQRHQAVDGFATDGGRRVTGVALGDATVLAETVVLAAGSWTPALARKLDLEVPIRVIALQMLRTDAAQAQLAPTVGCEGRRISIKQLPDGSYFIGGGWPGAVDQVRHTARVLDESVAGSWDVTTSLFASLADLVIADRHVGLEGESLDGSPLIGPAPGWAGLYLACGFSGHGFQLAPAIGDAVAEALTGSTPDSLLPLAADRSVPRE